MSDRRIPYTVEDGQLIVWGLRLGRRDAIYGRRLPETAILVPSSEDFDLRWFTLGQVSCPDCGGVLTR